MSIKKVIIHSFLAVLLPFMFADLAMATIYKTVDKSGNVIFTDTRPADQPSEEVKLRSVTPMSAIPTGKSLPSKSTSEKKSADAYTHLEIIKPANGATVRNQGDFEVQIATVPSILSGHKIRILLDGAVVGEPKRKLSFDLTNVDRGTHTLTVEIVDSRRKVIKSSSSVVNVHRTVYSPPPPPPS